MSNLIIKYGKFYRDGVFIPVEFGNKEQIAVLQVSQAAVDSLKKGRQLEYSTDITVQFEAWFKCVCGQNMNISAESDDEDYIDVLAGKKPVCRSCNTKYETYMKDGDIMIKNI